MIKITKFFYMSILCIPLFVVSYFYGALHTLLLAYCVAVIHELFHMFAAMLLSVKIKSILLMPFGLTLRLADKLIGNPIKEVIIAFSGPVANALMFLLAVSMERLYIWGGTSLFLFKYLNICMLFINLLPCMPLDGGRILRALLVLNAGYINAVSFQRKVEKIIIILLAVCGTWLLIYTKFNMSLVVIAAFLAFNLADEEKKKNYILMREIINCGNKLKKRKYMKTKMLTARKDIKAIDLVKRFGYDSFYIVNVVGDGMKVSEFITETEIIDSVGKLGFGVSVGEVSSLKSIDIAKGVKV